jgi:hypothetical protein
VNQGDAVAGGVEESHSDCSDLEEDDERGPIPAALPGLMAESSLDEQIVNFVIQHGPQVIARSASLSTIPYLLIVMSMADVICPFHSCSRA